MRRELLLDRRGAFVWLTINRHERRNALNQSVVTEMVEALEQARQDVRVRGIVITGAGERAFCAGADLQDLSVHDSDQPASHIALGDLVRMARELTVPLVARVNGACLGLGMALIGICHLSISFWARAGLLVAGGAIAASFRGGMIESGNLAVIWPVLAAMFMFRAMVYLYDVSNSRQRPSVSQSLAYFFLIPNFSLSLSLSPFSPDLGDGQDGSMSGRNRPNQVS